MAKNYHKIINSQLLLLLVHLLNAAVSQSPPVQVGDLKQYFLMTVNKKVNLTCPFTEVDFYKWNNLKSASHALAESRIHQVKITSDTNPEIYECEAVNGYGKRTATFITKGIDVNSKQFEIDCKSNEAGPCFLVSSTDNNFYFEIEEGKKVIFDCRTIMNVSDNKSPVTYSWRKIPTTDSFQPFPLGMNNNKNPPTTTINNKSFIGEKLEISNYNDMSSWNSIVMFDKVTKEMEGIYICTASNPLVSLSRNYRLKVKETKSITAIEGPLSQNISAALGSSHTLSCKASNSLSKPKWGKKLNKQEQADQSGIIIWEDNRYRILQGSLDFEHKNNEGNIKDAAFYENNLKLENIMKQDAGTYICSVLTKLNNLETKFVYISLTSGETKESSNFPLYIAGPIAVFVVCFGTILFCLIRRKMRQDSSFKNRAGRGTTITTTNTSSANGSSSGSRNVSTARQHMLPTTTTVSSKNMHNQNIPPNVNVSYSTNPTSAPASYGSNYPAFAAGYTPAVMNYNYTGHSQYLPQSNTTPSSTEIDHPCSHHTCMSHNNQNVPYDSDTTPSPPPPTSVTDTISTLANNPGNANMMPPYSIGGMSANSYSPNQSSQVYSSHQPSQNTSSISSSTNAPYLANTNPLSSQQQPVYTIGNMYSA